MQQTLRQLQLGVRQPWLIFSRPVIAKQPLAKQPLVKWNENKPQLYWWQQMAQHTEGSRTYKPSQCTTSPACLLRKPGVANQWSHKATGPLGLEPGNHPWAGHVVKTQPSRPLKGISTRGARYVGTASFPNGSGPMPKTATRAGDCPAPSKVPTAVTKEKECPSHCVCSDPSKTHKPY